MKQLPSKTRKGEEEEERDKHYRRHYKRGKTRKGEEEEKEKNRLAGAKPMGFNYTNYIILNISSPRV